MVLRGVWCGAEGVYGMCGMVRCGVVWCGAKVVHGVVLRGCHVVLRGMSCGAEGRVMWC